MSKVLLVHPEDDMVVALVDHPSGANVTIDAESITLRGPVEAKHKFARRAVKQGDLLKMYGIVVAQAMRDIETGDPLTTANLKHATGEVTTASKPTWTPPDVSRWTDVRFQGFYRPDERVGTRNHWIVVPLVFCQNRNVDVLRESLLNQLGYARKHRFKSLTERLIELRAGGSDAKSIRETVVTADSLTQTNDKLFPNVDGIKFLTHDGGCGGLYEDAQTLCGLIAGYINHPNVAGATVMSLGCQKSQIATLEAELHKRNADLKKPLYILEQQQEGTEDTLLDKALRYTFSGVMEADQLQARGGRASAFVAGS